MSRTRNAYASDQRQRGRRWYDGVLGKVIGDLSPDTEEYWKQHPEELESALFYVLNRRVPAKKRA